MVVNGVVDPVATVPQRLVRLRLLNAANARNFRLFFEDQRSFHLIATDGGFLAEPAPLSLLVLAPGERAEILVDFREGSTALLTGPDAHEHRAAGAVAILPDVLDRPARLLAFEVARDKEAGAAVPTRLAELPSPPKTTGDLPRRRFEMRIRSNPAALGAGHDHSVLSHGSMTNGPIGSDGHGPATAVPAALMTINGKSFAPGRIDEKVALGATEVWEIVCPDMAHPFHLHGAQFRVLSEDGGEPKVWNRGVKDTVLVENSAELLVTFTRTADAGAPFLYHCHLLEHEDGGMMGAFTVT
jgi:FtsP/CotA-like multicopper oxidase with cupredoxin domain